MLCGDGGGGRGEETEAEHWWRRGAVDKSTQLKRQSAPGPLDGDDGSRPLNASPTWLGWLPCFLIITIDSDSTAMPSPAAAKRRSISYTPDDDDDDGKSVHSGPSTSVRAPANQGGDVPMAQDADEDEDELEDDDDDDDEEEEEGRDDDEDGDELEAGDETGRADDTAMADVTMADAEVDGQDVKPSSAALSAGSAKKLKTYHISRASEPPIPPDVNPGSANLYSSHTGEKL